MPAQDNQSANRSPTRFGDFILKIMASRGIGTTSAFAELINVSHSTVSRWMWKDAQPSIDVLTRLSAQLDIDLEELISAAYSDHGADFAGAVHRKLHPLAFELTLLLDEDSALSSASREQLNTLIDRILDSYRAEIVNARRQKRQDRLP
jgi:transcriptional regulator with XRE-family HTH domain